LSTSDFGGIPVVESARFVRSRLIDDDDEPEIGFTVTA
jgi:hypothetical protein